MGCIPKAATCVLPPMIVELAQAWRKTQRNWIKYSEVRFGEIKPVSRIKVLVSTNKSMEAEFAYETLSGDKKISVGGLTVSDRFISRADCTLPYLEYAVQRYVPCAKCADQWTALLRVYTLNAWICVRCTPLQMIIFMRT